MAGFVDEIKSIFTEKTFEGLGYATISGLASATLGALLGKATGNKYVQYAGYVLGGATMAYVADRFLGKPGLKGYAVFGALFPPIYNWVTEKINPEELATKAAMSLGLNWSQAAETVIVQPVEVPQPKPVAPAASQTVTAEVFNY